MILISLYPWSPQPVNPFYIIIVYLKNIQKPVASALLEGFGSMPVMNVCRDPIKHHQIQYHNHDNNNNRHHHQHLHHHHHHHIHNHHTRNLPLCCRNRYATNHYNILHLHLHAVAPVSIIDYIIFFHSRFGHSITTSAWLRV